jgi:hypothetical protein
MFKLGSGEGRRGKKIQKRKDDKLLSIGEKNLNGLKMNPQLCTLPAQ